MHDTTKRYPLIGVSLVAYRDMEKLLQQLDAEDEIVDR